MNLLVQRYNYAPLSRIQNEQGRFYEVGQGRPLPSVTTILSATSDETFLLEWRERVGPEEASRILEEALLIGNHLHQNLENYLLGKTERTGPLIAKILTKLIIRKGLCKVSEVWGAEVPLYNPHLYAGTADVIGVHDNVPAVLDFKNSRANKKEEWITTYYCQCIAYANAHNAMYGTNIRKGVIMMGVRDGNYLEFVLEGEKFDHYEDIWNEKLYSYYETHRIE